MDNKQYLVVRYYQNNRNKRIQRTGLTLKQAQEWCEDPETSSMTAKNACNGNDKIIDKWHDNQKHWFDGYEEVK